MYTVSEMSLKCLLKRDERQTQLHNSPGAHACLQNPRMPSERERERDSQPSSLVQFSSLTSEFMFCGPDFHVCNECFDHGLGNLRDLVKKQGANINFILQEITHLKNIVHSVKHEVFLEQLQEFNKTAFLLLSLISRQFVSIIL